MDLPAPEPPTSGPARAPVKAMGRRRDSRSKSPGAASARDHEDRTRAESVESDDAGPWEAAAPDAAAAAPMTTMAGDDDEDSAEREAPDDDDEALEARDPAHSAGLRRHGRPRGDALRRRRPAAKGLAPVRARGDVRDGRARRRGLRRRRRGRLSQVLRRAAPVLLPLAEPPGEARRRIVPSAELGARGARAPGRRPRRAGGRRRRAPRRRARPRAQRERPPLGGDLRRRVRVDVPGPLPPRRGPLRPRRARRRRAREAQRPRLAGQARGRPRAKSCAGVREGSLKVNLSALSA